MLTDKLNIKVVAVGAAGCNEIGYMNDFNDDVDFQVIPTTSDAYREIKSFGEWYSKTLRHLDVLLIVSDLENDEVADVVLTISELSKKTEVLTLFIHAEACKSVNEEKVVKARLGRLIPLVSSTLVIKTQQLLFLGKEKGCASITENITQAYYQALLVLISPLLHSSYISCNFTDYRGLFSPAKSGWGNVCFLGVGRSHAALRPISAVNKALAMLPIIESDIEAAYLW